MDKTYAGKIANTGAQKVNAPFSQNVKKGKAPAQVKATKGKATVKTGTDLRSGK